jgi:uncharacterized protein YdcH (DUF465 family)
MLRLERLQSRSRLIVIHCPRFYPKSASTGTARRSDDPRGAPAERWKGSRQTGRFVIYYEVVTLCLKGTAPMDKAMVEELESKHAALHALIEEEEHRTHPDEDLLHRLKKEKLRLKDELAGHLTH